MDGEQTLTFVDQHNFDDGIYWYIDFVGAHAIGTAIRWPIIAVTKLLGIDFIILRQQRCRW